MNRSQVENLLASRQRDVPMSRNQTLDVYKGILIILVVIRHVLQTSVSDEGGILTNYIWALQMPGFMLVAGYFSSRKIENAIDTRKRILVSAQHYALPFFSWFLLITCLLLGQYDRNPIKAFSSLMTRVDRGLWFLWVVFVLSIVATLCNLALSSRNGRIIKTGIVLIGYFGVVSGLGLTFGTDFIGVKYILYYSFFYGFGWLIHKTEDWWKLWWPNVSRFFITVALIIFLAIVYNYDLYHASDNLISISLRCLAGFTGNLVLIWVCKKYVTVLSSIKLDWIGKYTLEIYATHTYVNGLMGAGNTNGFFTVPGFTNFLISLILTVVFSTIIIATFKAIPAADFAFYGKVKKKTDDPV